MSKDNVTVLTGGDEGPVFFTGKEAQWHSYVLGTTGKGHSRIIGQMARDAGVTYEEMERRMEPTEEQKAAQRIEAEAERLMEEKRLQAVRDAYWEASPEEEFNGLHDVIVSHFDVDPDARQVRAVYNLLPGQIVGMGVQWGMTDTVVGDEMYVFIEQNADRVRAALGID